MPIYEYRCGDCGHEFETIQKISEEPLTRCPACEHESLKKKVSRAAFRLKGAGWYETDFKSANKRNVAGSGDSAESGGKSDAGSSGSSGKESGSAAEKSSADRSSSEKSGSDKSGSEKSTSPAGKTAAAGSSGSNSGGSAST
ncbi:MAG: zinc ribbon domain-containing protein [Pseudomonadales bacterium]|nr:zinc ribbon domain-containing protein [Pseudomonadales bacterium]